AGGVGRDGDLPAFDAGSGRGRLPLEPVAVRLARSGTSRESASTLGAPGTAKAGGSCASTRPQQCLAGQPRRLRRFTAKSAREPANTSASAAMTLEDTELCPVSGSGCPLGDSVGVGSSSASPPPVLLSSSPSPPPVSGGSHMGAASRVICCCALCPSSFT